MKVKYRKTLVAIFTDPINGNLEWNEIETLFVFLGCQVVEGSGSSVTFEKDGVRAHFHRPHPARAALRYRIKAARLFLRKIGINP